MTPTEDHLTSLDTTLAAARSAWTDERKALLDRIFALETELALHKSLFDRASFDRAQAERVTAKLLTQFGVVSLVFDEAKQLALSAGLLPEPDLRSAHYSSANALPEVQLVPPTTEDPHS